MAEAIHALQQLARLGVWPVPHVEEGISLPIPQSPRRVLTLAMHRDAGGEGFLHRAVVAEDHQGEELFL